MNLRTKAIEAAQQALGALSSRKKAEAVVDAVLSAIREPNDAMEAAGWAELHNINSRHDSSGGCYRAMIDAITTPPEATS